MMDLNSKSGVLIFVLVGIVMFASVFTSNNDKVYADGKDFPYGIAIDSKDHVFVAVADITMGNERIHKFSNTGTFIREWGDQGAGKGQFNWPRGIAIDSKGNVFVADTNNDRIQKFSNTGKYIRQWGHLGGGNITTTSLSSPF